VVGGCAWDSFALPHLLPDEPDVLVSARCPGCGRALAWAVSREAAPAGVAGWLTRTGQQSGYLMDLATLWRLARGWYSGRLDRGHVRRDPGQARQYFRGAGLHGAFWGL